MAPDELTHVGFDRGGHGKGGPPPSDLPIYETFCRDESKRLRDQYKVLRQEMAQTSQAASSAYKMIEIHRAELRRAHDDLEKQWKRVKGWCAIGGPSGGFDIDGLDGTEPPFLMPPRPKTEEQQLRNEAEALRADFQYQADRMRASAQALEDTRNFALPIEIATHIVLIASEAGIAVEAASAIGLPIGVEGAASYFEAMAKTDREAAESWQRQADAQGLANSER